MTLLEALQTVYEAAEAAHDIYESTQREAAYEADALGMVAKLINDLEDGKAKIERN